LQQGEPTHYAKSLYKYQLKLACGHASMPKVACFAIITACVLEENNETRK
jgi:hypothetical protein